MYVRIARFYDNFPVIAVFCVFILFCGVMCGTIVYGLMRHTGFNSDSALVLACCGVFIIAYFTLRYINFGRGSSLLTAMGTMGAFEQLLRLVWNGISIDHLLIFLAAALMVLLSVGFGGMHPKSSTTATA